MFSGWLGTAAVVAMVLLTFGLFWNFWTTDGLWAAGLGPLLLSLLSALLATFEGTAE